MTQSSDRRILTLPAVHPCEAISPATLLHALISLCLEIDAYRSEAFPTHRRGIREAIREVGLLLAILEGIRDCGSAIPGSVILGFSELHVILQKIRYLLFDCARRGARLWVLMMSDRVSSELRILVRSIAVALEVLPLASIYDGEEVKELVQLVARQAREVGIKTDPADDRAIGEVRSILTEFGDGIDPAPAYLIRVLDHLHIQSWSQCNEEILFLEGEFLANRDGGGGGGGSETALLGTLMAFMAYCRATLFDEVDGKRADQKEHRPQETTLACLNSDNLRCPISLELMADPVTISTGHTYDRPSIEKWLRDGHLTCPVTGEKLTSRQMVPNSAVRKIVAQFCHLPELTTHHRKRDLAMTLSPSSSAAAGAIKSVAAFLVDELSSGTEDSKIKAAYEMRLLSKSSLFSRACLVDAGSVPRLLHLLYSSDPSTQENAIAALLNLSKHPKGRTGICDAGGLSLIVDVVEEGLKPEAQHNAAAILFYLSSVEEYRQDIGEIPEAIPALVDLLRRGAYRGKKNALVTLFGLLLLPGNHPKVLAAGAVTTLTTLLSTERDDLANDCVAVLAKLADRREGASAILRSSAVPLLVEVLRSSASRSGREYCVSTLLSLCNNGGERAVRLLEKMPLLMPSLYSLLTDGSPQAGKKARSLLNHIHRFQDECPSAALTSPAQDRIIHAL